MPTYEYRCKDCGEHLEVVQSFKDDALTECPACGGSLRKVFGNIGITFKGSGFYKTDSRSGASRTASKETASSDSSADKSSSETTSGDAKSDTKSSDSKSTDTKSSDKKSGDSKTSAPAKSA
jgi:putative FmdB family regulatory protein